MPDYISSRTRLWMEDLRSQFAAWITMYLPLSISANLFTMIVAFSGCLLTVTSL